MASRRQVLTGLLATACVGFPGEAGAVPAAPGVWLGSRLDPAGKAWLSLFGASGAPLFDVPLPARGHGGALQPAADLAVLLARRPGHFALVVAPGLGVVRRLAPGPGRFFCGHGAFAAGGRLFLATEQEAEGEAGRLAVFDVAAGFAPRAAYATGGIDPHELLVLDDGWTVAVANGGLSTDPSLPGEVLNLDEMDSSLALIDLRDGRLFARHRLPRSLRRLSLRHLALLPGGRIVVGLQHQGAAEELVPLLALFEGGALHPWSLPQREQRLLRGYVGSVAGDTAGRLVAVTSPRGGAALLLDPDSGAVAGSARLADVCGLAAAPTPGDFLLASGLAGLHSLRDGMLSALSAADPATAWDNHLLFLGSPWT